MVVRINSPTAPIPTAVEGTGRHSHMRGNSAEKIIVLIPFSSQMSDVDSNNQGQERHRVCWPLLSECSSVSRKLRS